MDQSGKINFPSQENLPLQAKVSPAAQLMTKIIDAEVIALNLNSGHCYKFDPIASAVWKLIEGKPSVSDILGELTDRYDAPLPEIQKDLEEILDFLEKEKLIQIVR